MTDRPNSGVLWNQKEKTKETAPDMTGDILLDAATLAELAKNGGRLSIAAWRKEGANCGEFFSLQLRPWVDRPTEQKTAATDKPAVKRGPGRPKKVVSDDLFDDE